VDISHDRDLGLRIGVGVLRNKSTTVVKEFKNTIIIKSSNKFFEGWARTK
jgi:hypothetical protein